MYVQDQDFKQDVGVVSLAIHARGIQEVHVRGTRQAPQGGPALLEQGCFSSHLLSFDYNKVLKIINWIC